MSDRWLPIELLTTEDVRLEPLLVEDADEMAPLLDDQQLHAFIGGRPATLGELRSRYTAQVAGHSADLKQRWLNWISRRDEDNRAVGYVQATVWQEDGRMVADVAWVVGTA